jgi:putative restriction endonuclease
VGDLELREEIFSALEARLSQSSGYISSSELASFDVAGQPRRLIANSKGIWNPRDLESTLSVVSSADGPYADEEISPGVWRYDYEKTSFQGSNAKLRAAMEAKSPIILLRKIATGVYVPHFPVYVVADSQGASPTDSYFTLAIEDVTRLRDPEEPDVRRYAERVVRQRVHQPEFRGKVLLAYENRCAVCRLRHPELLDAAHILPDSHPKGRPVVPNGLSLCKIHHGAYDSNLLGIDPDYQVHINAELLLEKDGPMLKHGLQEMHGTTLQIPRERAKRPSRDNLAERFEGFAQAG